MAHKAKIFALLCLSTALLGGCATPDAQKFIDQYHLQTNIGPLYEIVEQGRGVGWLYGSIHYATPDLPAISQAAIHAIAQTRHIYTEYTDSAGRPWLMRYVLPQNVVATTQARRQAALAAVDAVWNGITAAKKREDDSGGVVVALGDPSYHESRTLLYNYCGVFHEYGTEQMAFTFAAGNTMEVHALETEASRKSALALISKGACKSQQPARPAASERPALPPGLDKEQMKKALNGQICKGAVDSVQLDRQPGRTFKLSEAALCVMDERHVTMTASIVKAAKAGQQPFVIVGRAHLTHGKNLIQLLEEQGFELRRIE
jgi:TraB/PrgY/gumN family